MMKLPVRVTSCPKLAVAAHGSEMAAVAVVLASAFVAFIILLANSKPLVLPNDKWPIHGEVVGLWMYVIFQHSLGLGISLRLCCYHDYM